MHVRFAYAHLIRPLLKAATFVEGVAYQFSARISKCAWGWAQAGQAPGASAPSWT
jgi:hypothetical protein